MSLLRLSLVLLFGSCATAVDGDNPAPTPDARKGVTFPDAGPKADAGPLPDAAPPSVDAAAPGDPDAALGLFCEDNGDCTVSGECCFSLGGPGFCTPGSEVLDACIPD